MHARRVLQCDKVIKQANQVTSFLSFLPPSFLFEQTDKQATTQALNRLIS